MDWNLAISMNHEALKRILAMLVAMAGAAGFTSPRPTLPRHLHRAVLRLLRPAEAATRRLVIVAARDIVVQPPPPRSCSRKATTISPFVRNGVGTGIVLPPGASKPGVRPADAGPNPVRSYGFALLDPLSNPMRRRRPNMARGVPRIWAPGCRDPIALPPRREPLSDDPIDAARLGQRLAALGRVLDDLPRAARRFARWRAQAANASGTQDKKNGRRRWPLKPGPPPGARRPGSRRKTHEIDDVLGATHGLALWAMARADTS